MLQDINAVGRGLLIVTLELPQNTVRHVLIGKLFCCRYRSACVALFCLWWALLSMFHVFPQIDIDSSRAFYVAECAASAAAIHCGEFPLRSQPTPKLLRAVFLFLPTTTALLMLAILAVSAFRRRCIVTVERIRVLTLSIAALLVGPYLLVNVVLKSISGRPRPHETDLFGGHLPFVPAGSFSGSCENNCSFVSGEAAGAAWVACLIPCLPPRLQPALGPPLLFVALVTPAMRIAFGGHYLSDVILGGLLSPLVFCAVFAFANATGFQKNVVSLAENSRSSVAKLP